MRKAKPVSVRLSVEATEALEKAAQDEIRTVSGMLEKIVIEWLRANGRLGSDEGKAIRQPAGGRRSAKAD